MSNICALILPLYLYIVSTYNIQIKPAKGTFVILIWQMLSMLFTAFFWGLETNDGTPIGLICSIVIVSLANPLGCMFASNLMVKFKEDFVAAANLGYSVVPIFVAGVVAIQQVASGEPLFHPRAFYLIMTGLFCPPIIAFYILVRLNIYSSYLRDVSGGSSKKSIGDSTELVKQELLAEVEYVKVEEQNEIKNADAGPILGFIPRYFDKGGLKLFLIISTGSMLNFGPVLSFAYYAFLFTAPGDNDGSQFYSAALMTTTLTTALAAYLPVYIRSKFSSTTILSPPYLIYLP